jgi:mannose-6-phosphate isomerase-like protein (cupin superfamily)
MQLLDHTTQAMEEWRPGVRTRMRISALSGSVQLCIFEQWCDPEKGAPTHLHAVEEVLSVMEGSAEVWVESDATQVQAGQSVVIPAGRKHGFRNTGTTTLHVMATLASPMFEASFDAAGEISRRWIPTARP